MSFECIGLLVFFSCSVPDKPPVSDYCQVAQPIYWSAGDTRRTKEQADRHNRVWKRLCRGGK